MKQQKNKDNEPASLTDIVNGAFSFVAMLTIVISAALVLRFVL